MKKGEVIERQRACCVDTRQTTFLLVTACENVGEGAAADTLSVSPMEKACGGDVF